MSSWPVYPRKECGGTTPSILQALNYHYVGMDDGE